VDNLCFLFISRRTILFAVKCPACNSRFFAVYYVYYTKVNIENNYELHLPSKKEKKGKNPRFFSKKQIKDGQTGFAEEKKKREKKDKHLKLICCPK